jgi:hypothetical protein
MLLLASSGNVLAAMAVCGALACNRPTFINTQQHLTQAAAKGLAERHMSSGCNVEQATDFCISASIGDSSQI